MNVKTPKIRKVMNNNWMIIRMDGHRVERRISDLLRCTTLLCTLALAISALGAG